MLNDYSRMMLPKELDELQAVFEDVLRQRELPQNCQEAEWLAAKLIHLYLAGLRDAASLRAKLLDRGEP